MNTHDLILAARKDVVVFDRPDVCAFVVTGDDRIRFLHAMLSNDVHGVAIGSGNHSLLLNEKGKMIAELHVLVRADDVLILTHPDTRAPTVEKLDSFVVADDVEFDGFDAPICTVVGPSAKGALGLDALPTHPYDHREAGPLTVVHLPWGGPAWTVLGPYVPDPAISRADSETAEVWRIEAGIPLWGAELGEKVIPLEAGLDDALHLTKGCYLGQETIVRVLSRGRVNWHVRGLRVADVVPEPNDIVTSNGKKVGQITSAVWSPTLDAPIALARIRREVAAAGTEVVVHTGAADARSGVALTKESAATVVEGPFVDGETKKASSSTIGSTHRTP